MNAFGLTAPELTRDLQARLHPAMWLFPEQDPLFIYLPVLMLFAGSILVQSTGVRLGVVPVVSRRVPRVP